MFFRNLGLTFALYVLFEEHVLAVIDRIGKLRNPVAEYHQPTVARQLDVQFNMAMTEDEIVDIGMLLDILLGEEHQVLLVLTQIHGIVLLLMFDIAVLGPQLAEADAPAGMQSGE